MTITSKQLFADAQKRIPGGVNSPVRAFNSVGGDPVFVTKGAGAKIWTVEGRELTDFCGSWGPLILGHAHPEVLDAVKEAASNGMTFGINTPAEVEIAELLCELVPSMDMVRLVSSGTEATMTALRLARGATGRQKIIKFDGCYHGHSDGLLVAAGSGLLTGGISSSAGVPDKVVSDVFLAPYNDIAAVDAIVAEHGDDLAAIIVEPVAGNMGAVAPETGYLQGLRDACDRCGAKLIFDEVITGFRFRPTTFGNISGVVPDITCLGKIVGGGMPIGAVGGTREVMENLAPLGKVYQAGTLSGNPVAVAAGLTTLKILKRDNPYPELERLGQKVRDGINAIGEGKLCCGGLCGSFTVFFRPTLPKRLDEVKECDADKFAAFFHGMLDKGFYLPPSQYETAFISAAHTEADIDAFLAAAKEVIS